MLIEMLYVGSFILTGFVNFVAGVSVQDSFLMNITRIKIKTIVPATFTSKWIINTVQKYTWIMKNDFRKLLKVSFFLHLHLFKFMNVELKLSSAKNKLFCLRTDYPELICGTERWNFCVRVIFSFRLSLWESWHFSVFTSDFLLILKEWKSITGPGRTKTETVLETLNFIFNFQSIEDNLFYKKSEVY